MKYNKLAIALLFASLSVSSRSFAEPSLADVESAKLAYREGKELRAKPEPDLVGALARFKAAYALVPTPITALEVGRTHLALGHVLQAREVLLGVERLEKKPDESDKAADARVESAALAELAKTKLSSITIAPPDGGATAEMTLDGVALAEVVSTAPRVVDPGRHVVSVRTQSATGSLEFDVAEGESRTVVVPLRVRGGLTVQEVFAQPVTLVSVGVGALGIAVGTVTGLFALGKSGSVRDQCPRGQCPPSAYGDLDVLQRLTVTSTVSFGLGLVGLGVGAVSFLVTRTLPGDSRSRTLRINAAPGMLQLGGTW